MSSESGVSAKLKLDNSRLLRAKKTVCSTRMCRPVLQVHSQEVDGSNSRSLHCFFRCHHSNFVFGALHSALLLLFPKFDVSQLMISFLLLLLLLSHSSGEPFYVTNGAMIHQCHPASTAYVSKFDVNKMSCADRIWKQVTVTVDYWCDKNTLKRTWRLTTNLNEPTPWPSHISLNSVYGKDVKQTTSNINTNGKSETIQEGDQPFVASQAQMVSFMWSKPRGLQCRLKYNLPQDLCTAKAGKKFTAKCTCRRAWHRVEFDTICSSSSERTRLLLRTEGLQCRRSGTKGRVH